MDEFVFIDFKSRRNFGRGATIAKNAARLHYVTKESKRVKNPYYCITLNKEISNEIKDKNLPYLRLRQNTITGELYLLFETEYKEYSTKASFGRGNQKCLSIYNKGLVVKIMELLGIPKDENAESYLLKISENKSRIADVVCLQIDKFYI